MNLKYNVSTGHNLHCFKFWRIFRQIRGVWYVTSANGQKFFGIIFRQIGAAFPVKFSNQRIFSRNWHELFSIIFVGRKRSFFCYYMIELCIICIVCLHELNVITVYCLLKSETGFDLRTFWLLLEHAKKIVWRWYRSRYLQLTIPLLYQLTHHTSMRSANLSLNLEYF